MVRRGIQSHVSGVEFVELQVGELAALSHGEKALALYRQAAQAGDTRAQLALAHAHDSGQGATQDTAQALAWLERAAEAGDGEAQFLLAERYGSGRDVVRNDSEARRWLLRAAEQGFAPAQRTLAAALLATDEAQAIAWYEKAAAQNDMAAQRALGDWHERGERYAQAIGWWQRAVRQGDGEAALRIASAILAWRRCWKPW